MEFLKINSWANGRRIALSLQFLGIVLLLTLPLRCIGLASLATQLKHFFSIDEFYTWKVCQEGTREIIGLLESDVHPPLYFLMAKLVLSFLPNTIPVLRCLSLIFGLFTILLLLLIARDLLDQLSDSQPSAFPTSLIIAIALLANHLLLVEASRTARMYSLCTLLVALAFWLGIRWLKHRSPINHHLLFAIGFTWGCLCLAHNYGLIFFAAHLSGLAGAAVCMPEKSLRDRVRGLSQLRIPFVICMLMLLPILSSVGDQAQSIRPDYWVPGLDAAGFGFMISELIFPPAHGSIAMELVLVLLFLSGSILACKPVERRMCIQIPVILVIFCLSPILFQVILQRPILHSRYLSLVAPLVVLSFVLIATSVGSEWFGKGSLLTIGLLLSWHSWDSINASLDKDFPTQQEQLNSMLLEIKDGIIVFDLDVSQYLRAYYHLRTNGSEVETRIFRWNAMEDFQHVPIASAVTPKERLYGLPELHDTTDHFFVVTPEHSTATKTIPDSFTLVSERIVQEDSGGYRVNEYRRVSVDHQKKNEPETIKSTESNERINMSNNWTASQ